VLSRRAILALPFAAACGRRGSPGYQGYAFVANQDGQAIAAVDLQAMAVVRHIPLDSSPTQVIAASTRPSVYALSPESGSIHEIQVDRLTFRRKLTVAANAVAMCLDARERELWVLARDPRALVRVSIDSFRVLGKIPLAEEPLDFGLSSDGKIAAVCGGSTVRFVDLNAQRISSPLAEGDFGAVRFRGDGKMLVAADRGSRLLWLWDAPAQRLMTKLPLAVRPDHLCFSQDDGQLFVTGEGLDAVVIVFPYHTPEVDQTVLAGHGPQAMAASQSLLFIASPQSGDVSVLSIDDRKVIEVVPVGSDPGFVAITPDDQYALVLNRKSGDVAVLRVSGIQTRGYPAPLLTVIPVGSRPVSAAIRGV
jgi:DNA-binding beta-propeller fold protein YncE